MSNRLRLASEKAKRLRCPKCRECDLMRKGNEHICPRCEHIWPAEDGAA